jgi:ribosome-binding protein aMBF1 (putative translation factor)
MTKKPDESEVKPARKQAIFLHGEIKTPPFSEEARHEAGSLIGELQDGVQVKYPHAEPLTNVGPRCGVYDKKTRKIPDEVIADAKAASPLRRRNQGSTMMDAAERQALEAKGYRVYDHIRDALGMTEEEKQEFDLHCFLCRAIRDLREKLDLSQKQLAARLKVSKRVVDRMEWGGGEITLEQVVHAYAAMGGRLAITELPPHPVNGKVKKKARVTA